MKRHLAVLFASASVLAACGGGGGDDYAAAAPPPPAPVPAPAPPPSNTVPDSAMATVGSLFNYLLTLVGSSSETTEPLALSAIAPPVSETDEPSALP